VPRGPDPEREVRRRYDRLASDYDRRWARYVEASVEGTLERIDWADARSVLDVGCGSGAFLERVARALPAARLAGLDLSPGMLAVARRRLGPRAALVAGSAFRLPFRRGEFDLAVSTSALHHWSDPPAALAEMRSALRPGGRIAITDWCADRRLDRLRDRLLRCVERAHVRVYRSTELASLLAGAGFSAVRVERWRIGIRWSMMTGLARAGPV
jgi:ubiquinone/menaquinone biosynthesis C-methylase UbiE